MQNQDLMVLLVLLAKVGRDELARYRRRKEEAKIAVELTSTTKNIETKIDDNTKLTKAVAYKSGEQQIALEKANNFNQKIIEIHEGNERRDQRLERGDERFGEIAAWMKQMDEKMDALLKKETDQPPRVQT